MLPELSIDLLNRQMTAGGQGDCGGVDRLENFSTGLN